VLVDAAGRVLESVDARAVASVVEYNSAGQVTTATAAVGTPDQRVVRCYYDARMDLVAFDPPSGAAGRVQIDYCQYTQWYGGAPFRTVPEVYVGQPTRILYPDGTAVYAGYNGAEEPAWICRPDLTFVTLHRDALHRVYQVDYPQRPGYPAFSVTSVFDEFGRETQVTDANGTSFTAYDDLNRVVAHTPAVGRAVSYQYLPDLNLARWITRVSLAGTGTWEFGEDGKGREAQVLNPFGQLTSRSFDPDGKLLRETRANGTYADYAYTARDWPGARDSGRRIQHRLASGAILDQFDYFYTNAAGQYDPTGRLQREIDAGGRVHAFF
jgi:YD repeat-containing protein